MFEPSTTPRLFGVEPGADYPRAVVDGIAERLKAAPPLALANVTLFVNTARMQRRMVELFTHKGAHLLPRIRLIPDLVTDLAMVDVPPALPPLRRRLQLARLVKLLVEQSPDIAPRAAVFDLADSLAALIDEMQGEGVPFDALRSLDVANHSEHWARSLTFLDIVNQYLDSDNGALDQEARQRAVIEATLESWADTPPTHPVIVAGSTGSRGATALLMQGVAKLPQGAVILPGFDFGMSDDVWDSMTGAATAEDHPQFRFARIVGALGLVPSAVKPWHGQAAVPLRNRLVSLALRPAPVTDQWLDEGPALGTLAPATDGLTLIEAPTPRDEALAIALRLRRAVEEGAQAALITPDRMLTRRVTAALDRWGIRPDDSAGTPLQLSPPGRLLRQVAGMFGRRLTSEALLSLLKHPLTHSGRADRGAHLRHTRELELRIRRKGPVFPDPDAIRSWAAESDDVERQGWADWLAQCIEGVENTDPAALPDHMQRLVTRATLLAAGPDAEGAGELWEQEAGAEASRVIRSLQDEAEHGGVLTPGEFNDLIRSVLAGAEVRSSVTGHPQVAIWGTLEARVQGADLCILGGLNDGVWPDLPPPDPWLNRKMRADAGLLLPDRRIGLSAHDFQQAIAAREVVLCRAIRDAEAETVPSRWLNRLTNLLAGLPEQGGDTALAAMRARGKSLIAMAQELDRPRTCDMTSPAPRPSPRPPVDARPRNLSVTQIQTLIRDPYAIYARAILGLRPLDPLHPDPDARLHGVIVHDALEQFIRETRDGLPGDARQRLLDIAAQKLELHAPWPSTRRLWLARLERTADWFLETEALRRSDAIPTVIEDKETIALPTLDFSLTAKVDRIDRRNDGCVVVYDYKTGKPPSLNEMTYFDKQLLLEAAMVERGAFAGLGPAEVAHVAHISLGSKPEEKRHKLKDGLVDTTWDELGKLIAAYQVRSRGYSSRRALQREKDRDYDQLARFGEWDETFAVSPEEVGE